MLVVARKISKRLQSIHASGSKLLTIIYRLFSVGSRSHQSEVMKTYTSRLQEKFSILHVTSKGSSLKICLVAEGKVDLYPRFGLTSEWYTAAAHAILVAAGGSIIDFDCNELTYNSKGSYLNPYFCAVSSIENLGKILIKYDNK